MLGHSHLLAAGISRHLGLPSMNEKRSLVGLRRLSAVGCRGVYLPALTRIQFFEIHPHSEKKKSKSHHFLQFPTISVRLGLSPRATLKAGEKCPSILLVAIPMMDHDHPGNPLNKKLAQGESLHLMIKKTGASECSIVLSMVLPPENARQQESVKVSALHGLKVSAWHLRNKVQGPV